MLLGHESTTVWHNPKELGFFSKQEPNVAHSKRIWWLCKETVPGFLSVEQRPWFVRSDLVSDVCVAKFCHKNIFVHAVVG